MDFKSILVPVDIWESPAPQRHILVAAGIARSCSCPIRAITVLPDAEVIRRYVHSIVTFDQAITTIKEELQALIKRTSPADIKWTCDVVRGEIYKEILAAQKAQEIDLIVMPAHRPKITDFLIGSNAEKVARHASCSVLIVR
ncbi:MAG: universal stress protein [Rhodospirillaceae bacterium]|nr:universal stress protein [Rhodospirillaceae bacterium]